MYFAQAPHAAGIIEGIRYYNFLDQITIPNDALTDPDKAANGNGSRGGNSGNGNGSNGTASGPAETHA